MAQCSALATGLFRGCRERHENLAHLLPPFPSAKFPRGHYSFGDFPHMLILSLPMGICIPEHKGWNRVKNSCAWHYDWVSAEHWGPVQKKAKLPMPAFPPTFVGPQSLLFPVLWPERWGFSFPHHRCNNLKPQEKREEEKKQNRKQPCVGCFFKFDSSLQSTCFCLLFQRPQLLSLYFVYSF